MSLFFVLFVCGAIAVAGFRGTMRPTMDASFEAAKNAVILAINLIGIMAFWLGLMRILEAGGLIYALARKVKPLMVRLFPDVPPEHPAMGAMLLNMAANMLGLGNAATPFGIKAMLELNKLNYMPGVATNAMCLFLAINTSSITLLPLGAIGVRAAAGANNPANIFLPSVLATFTSTLAGVMAALWLARRDRTYRAEFEADKQLAAQGAGPEEAPVKEQAGALSPAADFKHLLALPSRFGGTAAGVMFLLFAAGFLLQLSRAANRGDFLLNQFLSYWLMPGLMLAIIAYGLARGVKVYEAVTDGAKQGFDIAVRIIPFLVAILVAIAMFRASGAMELAAFVLSPLTSLIGMPVEVVPMAIMRPLSGTGAFGVMSEITQHAPNSYASFLAATIQGSTETTFYVLAVYFGAAGISKVRHAVWAGITADICGILAACALCALLWQG